jgi:hypothetical protein
MNTSPIVASASEEILSPFKWWQAQRIKYNLALIVAGMSAAVWYAAIIFRFDDVITDADINLFTIAFQCIGYVVAMAIANILYFLGPITELMFQPNNVNRYRKIVFALGFWFSVCLPFTIPVFLMIMVLFFPTAWQK